MENGKTGVYLCKGCGIGDAVSVDDLEKVATGEFTVPLCRQHDCLCSEDGVKTIARDIGDGVVDRVVIAACSHRVMTDLLGRALGHVRAIGNRRRRESDPGGAGRRGLRRGLISRRRGKQLENGKTGVYLCKGCGIGDAVSVDDLEKVATGEFTVPLCRQHDCLCSEDGVKTIARDIGDGAVDRAVIASPIPHPCNRQPPPP